MIQLTLAEAAEVLEPSMSEDQLRQIITALRWQPDGVRYTGRAGRPVATYDATRLFKLHTALVPHQGLPATIQAPAVCPDAGQA